VLLNLLRGLYCGMSAAFDGCSLCARHTHCQAEKIVGFNLWINKLFDDFN